MFDTLGDGNDTVTVDGRSRHVNACLRDFLFPAERAQSPVKALSGGERNRLLLARLFTRPANLLVLDEPTNDLDLETLELLEAQLVEWTGTLLLVSHDRAFLDNVVTSTLVFEGNGRVQEYLGGYADWVRQRAPPRCRRAGGADRPAAGQDRAEETARTASSASSTSLPARIEALEAEQRALGATIADPGFYRQPAATITAALDRTQAIEHELGELVLALERARFAGTVRPSPGPRIGYDRSVFAERRAIWNESKRSRPGMTDLNDAVSLLQAKRRELAEQLDAVDKALAALRSVGGSGSAAPGANPAASLGTAPSVVLPTKLKPRRTLSDEHKRALSEGRRKAHHSKAAVAGLARELIDQAPALASTGDGRPPRLVKRTK